MNAIKGWIWLESRRLTQLCMGLFVTCFLFILSIRASTDGSAISNMHLQFQSSQPFGSSTQFLTQLQTVIHI